MAKSHEHAGGTHGGVIDVQTHYVPTKAARLLHDIEVDGISRTLELDSPMCTLDARLRAMDDAGVNVSVLSMAPIGVVADEQRRRDICRAANDGLLEACAAHPNRFVMAAALPLPDPSAAHAELARISGEAALRAVQIVAQTTGYRPDHGFDEVFSLAANQRLPILLHPAAGVADLSPAFDDYGLASGMHAMVSHALVAARMIQSGLLDRVPDLELILTHLGGILPFLIDRLDSRHAGPTRHPPSHYLRTRVHLDNCGYPAGPALRLAIDTVGVERLLIGSDWPSRPIAAALNAVRGAGLSEREESAIMRDNASRWFDPAVPRAQYSRVG
nr:amidohydrolase family protein [Altererythrobacter sp. C41]